MLLLILSFLIHEQNNKKNKKKKKEKMFRIFYVDCSCCSAFFEITLPQPIPKNTQPKIATQTTKKMTRPTKIRLCSRFWYLWQAWTKVLRLTMKIFKKKCLFKSLRTTQERSATRCEFSILSIH